MLLSFTKATKSLLYSVRYSCSHFQNYSQKINPGPTSDLSYTNPKYHKDRYQKKIIVPLPKKTQIFVEETKYRLFKEKMIGIPPPLELKMPDDPLWGSEVPKHYIEARASTELFKVIRYDGTVKEKPLPEELRFKPEIVESLTLENLRECSPFNIIQFLLKEKPEGTFESNLKLFDLAEKLIAPKLHEIALIDLVRLRHAFLGPNKFGSAKFLNNIKKIIHDEYKSLTAEGLLATFITERHSRDIEIQQSIIELLLKEKNLQHFTSSPDKLLDFIQCYAEYKIPEYKKKRERRVIQQSKIDNINFLSKLPLEQSVTFMTNQQKIRLMRAFFKMSAQGFKHILYRIGTTTNQKQLTPQQAIEYTELLSKLQNGEGYINTSQLDTMKEIFLANWQNYNNYQKLKIAYIYWNLDHSWQQFNVLYQEIPVEADINMLFLFSQIEITDSSSRQHQVLRSLMQIQIIPMAYYNKIKQFILYTESFGWNLLPLLDKMYQTELLINSDRTIDNLMRNKDIIALGKFLTIIPQRIQTFVPIENYTIIQFAYEQQLIGLQVLHNKDIAPNGNLKKSSLARTRTLESMGWQMIQLRWRQFSKQSINQQHKFLYKKLLEIIEIQEVKLAEREQIESQEVLRLTKVRQFDMMHFDDIDEFVEEMRPTQAEVDSVVLGIPLEEAGGEGEIQGEGVDELEQQQ